MSQADTSQVLVHPEALELAELERPTWPLYSAELRRVPTLVCEGDAGDAGDAGGDGGSGAGDGAGGSGDAGDGAAAGGDKGGDAPWGDDKNFDPERAKKLISGMRDDKAKMKADLDELRAKVQQHEDATKSDTQKLEERATGAETRADKAEAEAARLRVALRKGLTETQAKRLVGESEEDLEKDAEELLESFKADDASGQDSQRRPKERLRPGAAPGAEPEETDPAKLAAEVSRSW